MFDKCTNFFGTTENLVFNTDKNDVFYTRFPAKTQSEGTDDRTLSGTIRTDYDVEMRARIEFTVGIGDEVVKFNANNGARSVLLVIDGVDLNWNVGYIVDLVAVSW
jgi:hypothetical protein